MHKLKKNTWFIYYCFAGLGATLLLACISNEYDVLLSEKKQKQSHITTIVTADLESLFLKYEMMLDLLSDDFIENKRLNQTMVNNILQRSELLLGFTLYDTKGTLIAKSNNLPDSPRYHLKVEEQHYSWLEKGLLQPTLMVNKPTYSSILKQWFIPIQILSSMKMFLKDFRSAR